MKKLFVYMLAAMLAIPAIDLMSKPDTDKDKIVKTGKAVTPVASGPVASGKTVMVSATDFGKRKPKKVKTLKNDNKTLKRKYAYRKGARQM